MARAIIANPAVLMVGKPGCMLRQGERLNVMNTLMAWKLNNGFDELTAVGVPNPVRTLMIQDTDVDLETGEEYDDTVILANGSVKLASKGEVDDDN
jgi:hypothetical protein